MVANDNYLSEWRDISTVPPDYDDAFLAWDGIGICLAFIDGGRVACIAPEGDRMWADEESFTLWRPLPPSPPEEQSENELNELLSGVGIHGRTQ